MFRLDIIEYFCKSFLGEDTSVSEEETVENILDFLSNLYNDMKVIDRHVDIDSIDIEEAKKLITELSGRVEFKETPLPLDFKRREKPTVNERNKLDVITSLTKYYLDELLHLKQSFRDNNTLNLIDKIRKHISLFSQEILNNGHKVSPAPFKSYMLGGIDYKTEE